jgi:tetratricopeptide (TPR) repeat protein
MKGPRWLSATLLGRRAISSLAISSLAVSSFAWAATTEQPKAPKAQAKKAAKDPAAYPIQCSVSGGAVASKTASLVPPPTAAELEAFDFYSKESAAFGTDATDFGKRLKAIVLHHYEERRREILASIDREILLERQEMYAARDQAISRLEAFIANYSGPNADPEATPDAMFRLAALYEERARADSDADLAHALEPAVRLYAAVATEFPAYSELGAVLYYLGHSLNDSARIDEAQQAFRSLVCSNRYHIQPTSSEPVTLALEALTQDHDQAFWTEWYNKNPIPLDQLGTKKSERGATVARDEELVFHDPYQDCRAVPEQGTLPGDEPRYLAEVWWQIGNYHFDQLSQGGPYELNRAASAYEHSLEFKKPPLYGVSLYKEAWTNFKQQRYEAAVEHFATLLHYADEQQEKTGDPGADFRAEAYTYIAGSLTYVDFVGPPAIDPYIARSDALDLERDPLVAEEKMAVAIDRVQDPELIPQDKKWTVEIYKALAQEFVELNQNHNAIVTLELVATKFPLDRDAPVIVNRIAELYDAQGRLLPLGSPVREELAKKALEARTRFSQFVGNTPWTEANKEDPEALSQAEDLVRTGLQRAAADHTNFGRAFKDRALELSDPAAQKEQLERAVGEYQLATLGWQGYLDQDTSAADAYETRFWLADARFWSTVLLVPLGLEPSPKDVEAARAAASAVRDSNEDDRYEQPAAYYVVTLAEKVLEAAAMTFEESGGSRGLARRSEVQFSSTGDGRQVVKEKLPELVEAAVCARDEYNARIPPETDPQQNGLLYATQAAEYFFVYGQFAEARRRFLPIFERYCGQNKWGYNAWEKLVSMSNFEGNAAESRRLVEGKSCAYDDSSKIAEDSIRAPVRQGVAYMEARALFDAAMKMEDGPERSKKWREAAAAYEVALKTAPDRDDAPEAAMNAAYAYKQVGEYEKAISAYGLFIEQYGNDKTLDKLKSEDADKYATRVNFVQDAYRAQAGAYVLFFDYPKAAKTFDTIAQNRHFPQEVRADAAKQALTLYANLDDKSGLERAQRLYSELGATDESRAEAAFLVASAALKRWDPESKDTGPNKQARLTAQNAMEQYYSTYKSRRGAGRYLVRAAYYVALSNEIGKTPQAGDWWKKTVAAFEAFAAGAPKKNGANVALGSEEASMGAEAEYRGIDQSLRASFDYEAGFHHYKGTVVEVIQQYTKDATLAKSWYDRLGALVDKYASQKWAAVAIARQASLYDSLRTGLYNTRPPELKMFTPQQEKALKVAEESGDDNLIDKADQIRLSVGEAWRQKRDTELDSADKIVVDRYATAVLLARRYNLSDSSLTRAIRRLAFLTDVVGEAKMASYTATNKDLKYEAGMFQRMRPSVVEPPKPPELPLPSPHAFQTKTPKAPQAKMSGSARSAFDKGLKAFDKGDLAGASSQLGKATAADSNAAEAEYALGAVKERMGNPSEASRSYARAIRILPGYEAPTYADNILLARQGNPDAARSNLEAALSKSPDSAPLLAGLGEVQSILAHSGDAQRYAQDALKRDPGFQPAMVTLARDHYRSRRIDLALYTLQGILDGYGEGNPARDNKNAEAFLLRGLIFGERRLRGPAMDDLTKAAKLRPDLVDAHAVLASFMLEAGNAKDAVSHLEAAVRFDSRNPHLHAALGDAYRLLDRPADAKRELEWAISADPTDPNPHYTLGLVFLMSDKIPGVTAKAAVDQAIQHLETFKQKVPRGGPDDVDELITRAKTKKALLEAGQGGDATP